MKTFTFALKTLGCKVNQYDGEAIADELARVGLARVDFDETADVYVVNGCTVTTGANHKARQLIRRSARKNSAALIVVAGCYADGAREEIEELLNGSGLIAGVQAREGLPGMIASRLGLSEGASHRRECGPSSRSRPLVKVQDGCDNFCTYCIVPHVRGGLTSKPLEEALAEVVGLAAREAREIVLTGIHLGHYGFDLKPGRRLEELVLALVEAGAPRIRLSSIEMNEITPVMTELAAAGKLCRHFHAPLQSGSDRVLAAMNRRYTRDEFARAAESIRRAVPDVALTTDILAGFPGETDEDFEETLEMVERVGFSRVHAFGFSPRPGTPAAEMEGRLPAEVKEARVRRLISLGNRLATGYAARFVGRELEMIKESYSAGVWTGTSDNYLRVSFEAPDGRAGDIAKVRVVESLGPALYGRLVSDR